MRDQRALGNRLGDVGMARQYTVWPEEAEKPVWHGVAARVGAGHYRAGCGWKLTLRGRVWPVKGGDLANPLRPDVMRA